MVLEDGLAGAVDGLCALDTESEHQSVGVGRLDLNIAVRRGAEGHLGGVDLERNEAESVRENLVRNDTGVVRDPHLLDSNGGNFGEKSTTKCVGESRIDARDVKDNLVFAITFDVLYVRLFVKRFLSERLLIIIDGLGVDRVDGCAVKLLHWLFFKKVVITMLLFCVIVFGELSLFVCLSFLYSFAVFDLYLKGRKERKEREIY